MVGQACQAAGLASQKGRARAQASLGSGSGCNCWEGLHKQACLRRAGREGCSSWPSAVPKDTHIHTHIRPVSQTSMTKEYRKWWNDYFEI